MSFESSFLNQNETFAPLPGGSPAPLELPTTGFIDPPPPPFGGPGRLLSAQQMYYIIPFSLIEELPQFIQNVSSIIGRYLWAKTEPMPMEPLDPKPSKASTFDKNSILAYHPLPHSTTVIQALPCQIKCSPTYFVTRALETISATLTFATGITAGIDGEWNSDVQGLFVSTVVTAVLAFIAEYRLKILEQKAVTVALQTAEEEKNRISNERKQEQEEWSSYRKNTEEIKNAIEAERQAWAETREAWATTQQAWADYRNSAQEDREAWAEERQAWDSYRRNAEQNRQAASEERRAMTQERRAWAAERRAWTVYRKAADEANRANAEAESSEALMESAAATYQRLFYEDISEVTKAFIAAEKKYSHTRVLPDAPEILLLIRTQLQFFNNILTKVDLDKNKDPMHVEKSKNVCASLLVRFRALCRRLLNQTHRGSYPQLALRRALPQWGSDLAASSLENGEYSFEDGKGSMDLTIRALQESQLHIVSPDRAQEIQATGWVGAAHGEIPLLAPASLDESYSPEATYKEALSFTIENDEALLEMVEQLQAT